MPSKPTHQSKSLGQMFRFDQLNALITISWMYRIPCKGIGWMEIITKLQYWYELIDFFNEIGLILVFYYLFTD